MEEGARIDVPVHGRICDSLAWDCDLRGPFSIRLFFSSRSHETLTQRHQNGQRERLEVNLQGLCAQVVEMFASHPGHFTRQLFALGNTFRKRRTGMIFLRVVLDSKPVHLRLGMYLALQNTLQHVRVVVLAGCTTGRVILSLSFLRCRESDDLAPHEAEKNVLGDTPSAVRWLRQRPNARLLFLDIQSQLGGWTCARLKSSA